MEFSDIKCRYKQIDGYENYYVTECGDVYTYREHGGWQGLRKLKAKGINNPKRYLQVGLNKNGNTKYAQIHTLVATYFCDGYFEGAVVNHIDSNIHNNNYTNLEWITQKENIHKSYESSGVDQTRNWNMYELIDQNDNVVALFKGMNKAAEYVIENNLDASPSMLKRKGRSRGYKLKKVC